MKIEFQKQCNTILKLQESQLFAGLKRASLIESELSTANF